MRQRVAAAVSAVLLIVAACGDASEASADGEWAQEAEAVVALLADTYDIADPYQTARFFTAGGTLDLTVWGLGVARTPDEVVQAVRELWFLGADVRADHLVRLELELRHGGDGAQQRHAATGDDAFFHRGAGGV